MTPTGFPVHVITSSLQAHVPSSQLTLTKSACVIGRQPSPVPSTQARGREGPSSAKACGHANTVAVTTPHTHALHLMNGPSLGN